jgi:predicted acyl esterase
MIKTLIALSLGLPVLSSAISAQSDPDPLAPKQLVYVANNTIYHDAKRPSHVLLPVVPREDAPGLKFDEK